MTTYYEVLGVPADASPAQIRRAYVKLARAHHPDFHSTANPAVRTANERTMQSVNEAWNVLSDPVTRRRYDDRVASGVESTWRDESRAAGDERAHRAERRDARAREYERERASWRPFDLDDDDAFDPVFDDEPSRVAVPVRKQVVIVLPTLSFLVGVALVFLGVVINLLPLSALGAMLVALSALAFLVLPLIALAASARNDRR